MKTIVEEGALLESKAMIEEYAEDIENYGSRGAVFTVGGKGTMFRKKIVDYVLTFKTAQGTKEFKVEKNMFDRSHENSKGRLTYTGDRFVGFCTESE